MTFPIFSNIMFERRQEFLSNYYKEQASKFSVEEIDSRIQECIEYNHALLERGVFLTDPFNNEQKSSDKIVYENLLNLYGDGGMGSIEIPGITNNLIIYHGVEEDVLQKGVGHLSGSSLPVGGEGTHCLLSAHSGLSSKKLFTDLDCVKEGDIFYLHILGETLAYKVDQIRTILPYETDSLKIEKDKDYVTLITCTPYGVNSHRLLVRGVRIPYEEAKEIEVIQVQNNSTWREKYIAAVFIGVIFLSIISVIMWLFNFIKRHKNNGGRKI